jgi:Mor family transcriptional regulator
MLPAATPVTAAPVTVTIVSDTTTLVTEINNTSIAPQNAVLAWEPGPSYPNDGPDDTAWANNSVWDNNKDYNFSGSSADWIWDTYRTDGPGADAPKVGRVVRFVKKFDLPCPPSSAILHITADNGYQVWVNGNPVGSAQVAPVPGWATSNLKEASLNSQGWQTVESYTVNPAFFNVGANTLEVLAGNEYFDTDDSGNPSSGTASNNPGGVIFELDIEHEDCNSCCMQIKMPEDLAAAGAKVNIRYDNPDKDFGDGDSVYLPKGNSIQWQLKVGGFASAWKTKSVDCSALVVTDADYCLMTIQIPTDAKVDIRYDSPDKQYVNGDSVYLPKGNSIQWKIYIGGSWSGWQTKNVDCSDLVYP